MRNESGDPGLPGGVTFAPLPAVAAPALTLELQQPSPAAGVSAVTFGLNSYEFGFENATSIGAASGGAGAGKAKFDDLTVSAPLGKTRRNCLRHW